jgi:hypothetical protein
MSVAAVTRIEESDIVLRVQYKYCLTRGALCVRGYVDVS